MYRWEYICDFSRSVGAGSATTRKMRGLTRSVIALIVPPLPAPSRPSKRMQTFRPACTTHCWSLTNSTCNRASSCSYPFRFSLPLASGASFLASAIGSSLHIRLHIQPFLKNCPKCVLLPSKKEADITRHAPRILKHLGLQVVAERPEVIVPEFVSEFGAALQGRFPIGLRVVDPSAAIAAQRIRKTVDLHFALSALGCMAYQRHHYLHQLLGRPLKRFVKLLYYRFLLFLLFLHMAQVFGGLRRLALGHSALHISGGKNARRCRLRRAAIFGHDLPSFRVSRSHQRPGVPSDHQILVGFYNIRGDAAVRRADAFLMFAVGCFVQLQPEPTTSPTDRASHRRRILTDTSREHDSIETTERCCERGDMAGYTIAKHLDSKARSGALTGQELAEIGRNTRKAKHAGAAIQEVHQLFRRHPLLLNEVEHDAGIEFAAAGAHRQPVERGEPHRRCDRGPFPHCAS